MEKGSVLFHYYYQVFQNIRIQADHPAKLRKLTERNALFTPSLRSLQSYYIYTL